MVTATGRPPWLSYLVIDKRRRLRQALELCGAPLLYSALWFTKLYRPSFHVNSPVLHRLSDHLGVYPVIDHYHEPLIAPDRRRLEQAPVPHRLPGVELNDAAQLDLLAAFGNQPELLAISQSFSDLLSPYYDNHAFPPYDAQALFSMIRHLKPSRIIEVGSGESSRFARRALALNGEDDPARVGRLTCIEPFEAGWLEALDVDVLRSRVEDLSVDEFTSLGENDILFIDSSHVARPGGDVQYLLTDVIPSLRPGVMVHVHDIFTPRGYPQSWIEQRRLWDEQYILEALLTDNPNLRVVLALNHLYHTYPGQLRSALPAAAADDREPASFWFRVVG